MTTGKAYGPATDAHRVISAREARLVRKPWGQERWLVPESAPFGFKLIEIRAGCRTSLQYHREKEEAAFILSGHGILHISNSPEDPPTTTAIGEGEVMHIRPFKIHRIHAITDVQLIEVSTPHLDDVIRVADDFRRPDGRILSEHQPLPQL